MFCARIISGRPATEPEAETVSPTLINPIDTNTFTHVIVTEAGIDLNQFICCRLVKIFIAMYVLSHKNLYFVRSYTSEV